MIVNRLKHRFQLILVARLVTTMRVVVIAWCAFLTERNTTGLSVVDTIVLDNPTLTPVRTNQAWLLSSRWRPRCCCLGHFKATHRDVITTNLTWIEHIWAHVHFNQMLWRLNIMKISINCRHIIRHFSKPLVLGTSWVRFCNFLIRHKIMYMITLFTSINLSQWLRFVHRHPINVNVCRVRLTV